MLSPLMLAGCNSYPWLMIRDNMLRPTPYMRVTEKPKPGEWQNDQVTVCWIGHATVLVNFHGTVILTDPVLGERLAPPRLFGKNLGIRRITELPVRFEELPRVDVVLLSHAHYDHWDVSTLARFGKETRAIIPPATSDLIPSDSFGEVTELNWGKSAKINDVTITAVQVEHWGMRGDFSTWRGYNGYVIEGGGKRLFFGGDSAYLDRDSGGKVDWAKRVGPGGFDLCMLPIGGYHYHWNHMSPEEAWALMKEIGGKRIMPIHWRTFIVSPVDEEPIWEPIERLKKAAGNERDRIVCEEPGKTLVIGPQAESGRSR